MESYHTIERRKVGGKVQNVTVLHSRKKYVEVPAEQWEKLHYFDLKDYETARDEYEGTEYDVRKNDRYYNVFDFMLQQWDNHNHEQFWINAFDLERVLNKLSDEDLDIYLLHKERHLKQKQIAETLGKSEAHVTRRMKVIEDTIEYDLLDDGERTKTQIKAEIEYRKYLRSGKTESFVDVYVYDFLLIFPQEVLLRYLFVFRGQQHLMRFCFLWIYEYFASKDKSEFKARDVLGRYSYQLFHKYMIKKNTWAKQLFIAVELELQRLLKQYGIKDSKPNEKFIKTVQKSAAARGMTVAEYRDKILFPHGKERVRKRFEQYYKRRNKAKNKI
ncbi:MAG: sigma-70 region 4 domain-containing protein [Clostridia bacterium]|nr:sigma-70 region 4 domain-containing protein [Clostridia bacterium]